MDSAKTARNVAIVVVIAAAVYFLPGGGRAASTFQAALGAGFAIAIGFLAVRTYRERRVAIHSLGDTHRALLYGGIALALFAYMARVRMWQTGIGELAWFLIVAFVVYALMEVFRHSRAY